MRGTSWIGVVLLLGAAAVGSACENGNRADRVPRGAVRAVEDTTPLGPAIPTPLPQGFTAATVQSGRRLYAPCAVCHGPDAGGTQLGPSLRDEPFVQSAGGLEEVVQVIRNGVAEPEEFGVPMPAYAGELTDEQLRSLASYVFALRQATR
jgi:mono/diheme cytochrome c family protein